MKPDNALELEISADLSEASLETALLMVAAKLSKKQINYGWISIPSQSLGTGVMITKYSSFFKLSFPSIHLSLEINSEYDVDEWSVTINNWDFSNEKPTNKSFTVWSAGA